MTVLVLVAILIHSSGKQKDTVTLKENNVSIGKYAYHFSDGKAIKQTDVMTLSLEKVLVREGQKI